MPHRLNASESGFSLVESLLLVIAVALVAFVGYYVWHSQKTANQTYNSASKVAQSSPVKNTKAQTKPASPGGQSGASSTAKTVIAADSPTPASGYCPQTTTVELDPDVPNPRCIQVTASQSWKIVNKLGKDVTVDDGAARTAVAAGATASFDFTKYSFAAGVHTLLVSTGGTLSSSVYGDSGPEVWVK